MYFTQSVNSPNVASTVKEFFSYLSFTNISEGLTNLNSTPIPTDDPNSIEINKNSKQTDLSNQPLSSRTNTSTNSLNSLNLT